MSEGRTKALYPTIKDRRFNRITASIAATIPLEEAHEQAHGEARWGENRRRDVRNALSRSSLRVIGKGNPQDRPPSPVDLGDGEGGYHCTRWSNSTSGSGWASGSSSGSTSTGASSHAGGPRAAQTSGGRVGPPMCSKIARNDSASVTKAMICVTRTLALPVVAEAQLR